MTVFLVVFVGIPVATFLACAWIAIHNARLANQIMWSVILPLLAVGTIWLLVGWQR